jgi:hypothetical protein
MFLGIACLGVFRYAMSDYQTDYMSFWAAGRLTLGGNAAAAYDIVRHHAVQEAAIGHQQSLMPFPYPPPFLLAVTPFSLLPYVPAFVLWVALSALLYWRAAMTYASTPYAMAQPAVLLTSLIGQSAFVTAAIMLAGLRHLDRRPILAGGILGLMIVKPQLALLLPVAVVAGRRWSAVPAALLTMGLACATAWLAFGAASFQGFFHLLPVYGSWLGGDEWPWNEFASAYAFVRYFGGSAAVAIVVQLLFAALAAAVTAVAWWRGWEEKVPVLAAATMLVPPYLLTYDSLLMLVPIAWWIGQRRRIGLVVLMWIGCWLPVGQFMSLYTGPTTIPLTAILALGGLVADRLHRPNSPGAFHLQRYAAGDDELEGGVKAGASSGFRGS